MVEAGGSIKKDNMVMAIGAVTEAGREETRVAAREVDSSVRAEPMMAVGGYSNNQPVRLVVNDRGL